MKLRKGWIFRTIYLERGNLIACYAFYIVFMILGLLVQLSTKIGNLSHMSEEDASYTIPMLYYLFVLFSPFVISISMEQSGIIFADVKSGWSKYEKTLPMSTTERTAYRIGTMIAFYINSLILSIINMVIFTLLNGETYQVFLKDGDFAFTAVKGFQFDTATFKMILIILMCTTFMCVLGSVTSSIFKNQATQATISFISTMIIYVAIAYGLYQYTKKTFAEFGVTFTIGEEFLGTDASNQAFDKMGHDLGNLVNLIGTIAPVITILLFVIGFFLTKWILEKREG